MAASHTEVTGWQRVLAQYAPQEEAWKGAEAKMRAYAQQVLRDIKGTDAQKRSATIDFVKDLVPEDVKPEVESLPVEQFALGLIFYGPFQVYDRVYRHISSDYGKEMSMQARKGTEHDTTGHVYGEIAFFPFADILLSIAPELPQNNAIFYDLGSGVGKAVVAAALLHPFHKSVGIEVLQPLVDFSLARVDKLGQDYDGIAQSISFVSGSFLDHPWSDGDLVFSHSTCFSPGTWERISKQAEQLKQGAYFVSVSHVLLSPLFEVLRTMVVTMSWGSCTVYVHRRMRIGRWATKLLQGGSAIRTDLQRTREPATPKENEVRKQ
ncbi:hypothetical protein SDRG_00288 [Saprolegnia diclina VS20]|uniref:Histone-lysine N-methyltransferase, H3 lysine-79 specific n=1 Tax=Saprolegnia diclina (strain VS20) TaxID=1156394 RepID=T0SB15_SAPDV|nr:hypothetical protein SDRG_00288 [Saprolegnia diclina VS20]EQC42558.1 hypothetical protein SDRG_00288 [Saprolegnia diclina VS20]|eukprot:XP_008603981.1 hypothetical protein SDRG_00288 [Saprolegnia diclina VS20]